ncbi:MAG: ABC transporter ATP-binding protein [Chloroflexota bacterium]|jgi:ABC-2 type transport system ATP-binding protein
MAAIVTESLGKTYGGHGSPFHRTPGVLALHDLSIEVHEAEIFGFLGPNGAGKSTTIRLLLGYLHPSEGRAQVLGHDIVDHNEEIRRRTGYLPGGIAFYDTMTGAEQLDYLSRLDGRPSPLRDELVERMELSRRDLGRQIRDYSRGMRQKVGIIQALQSDPELAILDEPTEGLDPLMQRAFYEILEDRRAAGRTIFFSSHILSEVERVCDRVAIVRKGQLVALTDIGELLDRRRRRVEIRLSGPPPRLEDVPGVSHLHLHEDVLTCQLEGDPGPLVAALQGTAIRDLLIEPARLEEAFMEYYADDDAPAERAGEAA